MTHKLNEEKNEKEKLTYQRIGRKLDIMGYQKAKTGNGSSAIMWNDELNRTLAIEHEVLSPDETPETPLSQETSETPVSINEEEDNIIGIAEKIFKNDENGDEKIPF